MSKQWQLRRGTTADNEAFTGAVGEVSYDTELKRVRIHDGSTQGGFQIANMDDVYINSASTNLINVGSNIGVYDYSFPGVSSLPLWGRATLVCQTAEAGYAIGEETSAFGIGDYTSPLLYTYVFEGVARARLFVGGQAFWIPNKENGVKTNITNANWKLKLTIFYYA